MGKILVTGASGSLGLEVIKALYTRGYFIRAMVNDVKDIYKITSFTQDIIIADARKPNQLLGLCEGIEVVISTVGKSISLFKNDKGTYDSIDYNGNKNIFREAEKSGVERIIFTSIMGCSKDNPLKLSKVHHKVEKLIAEKFRNYLIFRPTGFFSGLNDLIIIGKRGFIPLIGNGEYKTNSIHQSDLAQVMVDMLYKSPNIVELGGPKIHTRQEMAEMIQKKTGGRIIHIPSFFVKGSISLFWPIKTSLYHNMDYFRYVTTRNMVGKKYGQTTFESYLEKLDLDKLP